MLNFELKIIFCRFRRGFQKAFSCCPFMHYTDIDSSSAKNLQTQGRRNQQAYSATGLPEMNTRVTRNGNEFWFYKDYFTLLLYHKNAIYIKHYIIIKLETNYNIIILFVLCSRIINCCSHPTLYAFKWQCQKAKQQQQKYYFEIKFSRGRSLWIQRTTLINVRISQKLCYFRNKIV